jgi:lysophospholipase L1-like esterase
MSTASQAMRLFRNCLSVRDTANGLLPVRFTDAQLAVYAKSELFGLRSFLPAGIAIDIMTDTRHIEIDFAVEARIREWINFDVHVDGIFMATLSPDLVSPPAPMAPSEGRLRWDLLEGFTGIHRLTLYLPHCVKLTVRRLGFSEGAEVRPAPEGRGKLLCLGDSITQGMDALHPSSTYPVLIARAMKFDLLNQGVGGFFFDADSLDPSMHYNPDIVTVAYGTNDWNTCASPHVFRRNASAYIEKLAGIFPKARIFILSPIWRKDLRETKAAGTFHSLGQTIAHICASHPSIRFVDGMRLVPHQERFFGDGPVHPNDEGFVHFALNLAASLQESC